MDTAILNRLKKIAQKTTITIDTSKIEPIVQKAVLEKIGSNNPYKIKKSIFDTLLSLKMTNAPQEGWGFENVSISIERVDSPFSRKLSRRELNYVIKEMSKLPNFETLSQIVDIRQVLLSLFAEPRSKLDVTTGVYFYFDVKKPERIDFNRQKFLDMLKTLDEWFPVSEIELGKKRKMLSVVEHILSSNDDAYDAYVDYLRSSMLNVLNVG